MKFYHEMELNGLVRDALNDVESDEDTVQGIYTVLFDLRLHADAQTLVGNWCPRARLLWRELFNSLGDCIAVSSNLCEEYKKYEDIRRAREVVNAEEDDEREAYEEYYDNDDPEEGAMEPGEDLEPDD